MSFPFWFYLEIQLRAPHMQLCPVQSIFTTNKSIPSKQTLHPLHPPSNPINRNNRFFPPAETNQTGYNTKFQSYIYVLSHTHTHQSISFSAMHSRSSTSSSSNKMHFQLQREYGVGLVGALGAEVGRGRDRRSRSHRYNFLYRGVSVSGFDSTWLLKNLMRIVR